MQSANVNASGGATINAVLEKSVDAKKAKVGDQVEAKTTADARTSNGATIPKGSKLFGHVTEVKAREKGNANAQSSIAIGFDRAVIKGGQEVPIHAVIQAIAPPPAPAIPGGSDMQPSSSGGGYGQSGQGGYGSNPGSSRPAMGGPVGQTTSTAAGTAGGVADTAGATAHAGAGSTGQLGANATGVMGIKDLRLETQASDSTHGSVITSDNKNVKLESGTQLLLRVTAQ